MRVRSGYLLILNAIIIALAACSCYGNDDFTVARVVKVEYPESVQVNQNFQVNVTVEYVESMLADVCIREVNSNNILQSLTMINTHHGPGETTFIFNLTSPEEGSKWKLMAMTRVWWENSWFSDLNQGKKEFTIAIVPEDLEITLKLSSAVVEVISVDGLKRNLSSEDRTEVYLNRGWHILETEPLIVESEDVRWVFDRWSDGSTSNPRSIYSLSDIDVEAVYRRQYRLQVLTEKGEAFGGGWYDEDAKASFGILYEDEKSDLGFNGWRGDSNDHAYTSTFIMDGPKKVEATWSRRNPLLSPILYGCTILLLGASIFMIGSIISNQITKPRLNNSSRTKIAILLLISLFISLSIPPNYSDQPQEISQPEIVQIGEASYRYWHRSGSDTCLLWLGGGVMGRRLEINPYWLESYNTMMYIQDLSRFYSVLALEKGSTAVYQHGLNRTIHREIYNPSYTIKKVRGWIEEKGYRHIYLVGYSLGGIGALEEATLHDIEGWRSPNGVILITVPFSQKAINKARDLESNLLILFGEDMTPLYIRSGQSYFNETRPEGDYGEYWFHKEFHILSAKAHEVWTFTQSGAYSREALTITLQFIEESKILQHKKLLESIDTGDYSESSIIKVQNVPRRLNTKMSYQLTVQVLSSLLEDDEFILLLVEQDNKQIYSAAKNYNLMAESEVMVHLTFITPYQEGDLNLGLYLFTSDGVVWQPFDRHPLQAIHIKVSDKSILEVDASHEKIPVMVNGRRHVFERDKTLTVEVEKGIVTLSVPKIVNTTEGQRLIFYKWSDGVVNTSRSLEFFDDTSLKLLYLEQYYLKVRSEFGDVSGEGWHYENSTVKPKVTPSIIEDEDSNQDIFIAFMYWENVMGTPLEEVYINDHSTLKASWRKGVPASKPVPLLYSILLIISILVFITSFFMKYRYTRVGKSNEVAKCF